MNLRPNLVLEIGNSDVRLRLRPNGPTSIPTFVTLPNSPKNSFTSLLGRLGRLGLKEMKTMKSQRKFISPNLSKTRPNRPYVPTPSRGCCG
jgi:hypothetical protein